MSGRVGNRNQHRINTKPRSYRPAPTSQPNLGTPRRIVEHLDVSPANSVCPTGAQDLHYGLLGCEPCRQMFDPPLPALAICQLAGREDAIEEIGAMTVDNSLQTHAFDKINSMCYSIHIAAMSSPGSRRDIFLMFQFK